MNTCNKYYKRELQNRKLSSLTKLIDSLLIAHSQQCCWLALHGLKKRVETMKMTTGTQIWKPFVHSIGSTTTARSAGRSGSNWNLCKVGLEYAGPAPARPHPAAGPSPSRSRNKAQGLWNVVSSGHLIYRLLVQEAEENLAVSSIWSIYGICVWQETRPFSSRFPSIQQKSTLLLGSPAQHLQAQLQSRQACLSLGPVAGGTCRLWAGASLPAGLPWLCFPWEPGSWGPAWFISSI